MSSKNFTCTCYIVHKYQSLLNHVLPLFYLPSLLVLGTSAQRLHECVWPRVGMLGLGVMQVMVVMYFIVCTCSTDCHHSVHNVWNWCSLCGHCHVILPTDLPG